MVRDPDGPDEPDDAEDWVSWLDAVEPPWAKDVDEAPSTGPTLRRRRRRRDRRGPGAIFRRIDLHGRTKVQAAQLLEHWVREARREGGRVLLVVTGRGLNSPDGPVLKQWLEDWAARESPWAPMRLRPARTEDGGEGAAYLLLD